MTPKHPPGPQMTLGNMREHLIARYTKYLGVVRVIQVTA
jgi:hypothetical protein